MPPRLHPLLSSCRRLTPPPFLSPSPQLLQGANKRDVYLTEGLWRDLQDESRVFEGGRWLLDCPAPLDTLPCFVRVGANLY